MRGARHEDGDAQLLGQNCQSVNMIAVLVRDENRGKRIRIFAQRLHALESLPARNSRIYQNFG
jgi:hypothetical protein